MSLREIVKKILREEKLPASYSELIKTLPEELKKLFFKQWGAKQNPEWHPEGNSLKHIIVVLKRAYHHYPDDPNMIMTALFHDLGKMDTYDINPKTGKPTAYGHEFKSTDYVEQFRDWIESFEGTDVDEIKYLVSNHMKVKPKTWDSMRDTKKEPIINNPAFDKLMGFTGKLDGGGTDLKESIRRILREESQSIFVREIVDVDDESYITMNIKNFPKYEKELTSILYNKLVDSKGDFVTFKNSVIKDYDDNKVPILFDELQIDNRFLNYMVSMGSKKFNSLLYKIFTDFYGTEKTSKNRASNVIDCDPSNFQIVGPITAKDSKSLMSYWIGEPGGRIYRIKLPDECYSKLEMDEKRIYVTVEAKENRIHFPKGVPERLRGKKLGTLIYMGMIKKLGYITSSMGNSAEIKMIYQDLITNPKYENDIMSLLLQKQIIIFDRNTTEDVKKIFNDFVSNKFTDKKSVKISQSLKDILGEDFTRWYESLDENQEHSIEDKIKKYEGMEPKGGDTVVDTTTGKIYSFNGEWEDKGKKQIHLSSDKFESLLLPAEKKTRFKVIHRK